MKVSTQAPPSDDKRWRIVNATMRRYGYSSDALIETLHTIQETFGYLDELAMRYAASSLHVPLSKVYGVATFYNHFMLKPKGGHSCVVCMGTACYIKNSAQILGGIQQTLDIGPNETTPDGKISLSTASCVGMCWAAPVILFDDEVQSEMEPDNIQETVQKWVAYVNKST